MVEAEIVVGYLIVLALRKAKRFGGQPDGEADQVLDAGLDRLHSLLTHKLAGHPVLADLEHEAAYTGEVTELTRQQVELAVRAAESRDSTFARNLAEALEWLGRQPAAGAVLAMGLDAVALGGAASIHVEGGGVAAVRMGDVRLGASPVDPFRPGRSPRLTVPGAWPHRSPAGDRGIDTASTVYTADRSVAANYVGQLHLRQHRAVGAVAWPLRIGAVPALAPAFQPRPGVRERIDQARTRAAAVVLAQMRSGGGGVGKSQLATAYAHQALRDGVDLLVWLDATSVDTLVTGYAAAAVQVRAPGVQGVDPAEDARRLLDWLASTDRSWLVVLDDITDPAMLARWWPPASRTGTGRVLATTRSRDAALAGAGRAVVEVDAYSAAESRAYLTERLTRAGAGDLLDTAVDALAIELGQLPLALAHAAAYMLNERVPCTAYRALCSDWRAELVGMLPPEADEGYGWQVATTVLLALNAAQARHPAGLALPAIGLVAMLDPAGHPDTLWETSTVTDYLTSQYGGPPVTLGRAHAVLWLLRRYALLNIDALGGPRAVRVHALTAWAVREALPEPVATPLARAAADALLEAWPPDDHTDPELVASLRTNTTVLASHAADALWHPGAHPLLYRAGNSLLDAGLHTNATSYWRTIVAHAQHVLGGEHPDTLIARANLAASHWRAGRTDEAITLLETVVADREWLLDDQHPDALIARANLAGSYRQAGRTGEAITIEEKVVADMVWLLGDQHPDTLSARANLAASYWQAGRTDETIALLENLVADRERLLGDQHPDTLSGRANLAASYWQAGRTGEAITIEEKVVADMVWLLGDQHPDTLIARANLAASYAQAGRTLEAITLLEKVIGDMVRLLGDHHPDALTASAALRAWRGRLGQGSAEPV